MEKKMLAMMLAAVATVFAACSSDDPYSEPEYLNNLNQGGNASGGISSGNTSANDLASFDIAIDKETAEPSTSAEEEFPEEEDNLDNNSFTTEVNITFDGNNVYYDEVAGITFTADGAHLIADHGSTKSVCYILTGTTTAGSLTVIGDKKYAVQLNGVSITNPDSAAVNLLSKKRAYVILNSGTANTLTDAASTAADHKAAFYCKGKLLFNGSGALEVYGNNKNAIQSADYIVFRKGNNVYAQSTANHGIKANDGIYINGGILNVEVSAEAAKGINCEADIAINGGRTTVITTGNGTFDTEDNEAKGAAGIKADGNVRINDGQVLLKSTGSGGKGIKSDLETIINGGLIHIITTGGQYASNNDTASPKGIKADGNLTVNGGDIMVRTTGKNGEGIESKSTMTINDGSIQISAYDDAINSTGDLYITGGSIVAIGTNNDGIDSNGNMYISGGNIIAYGANGAETGIDVDEQHKLYLTGGALFAIGGRIDLSVGSSTDSQALAQTSGSVAASSTVTISNGTTTLATFTMPPYSYSNGTIVVSAPGMSSGTSYTLTLGSSTVNVTASNSVSGGMGGGMQPGGGGPGGGRW